MSIYDDAFGPRGGDLHVRQALSKLNKTLKLTLPQGRGGVEGELDASLEAIKEYNPKDFRPVMKELGAAFKR